MLKNKEIPQLVETLKSMMKVEYLNSLSYEEVNSLYNTANELRRILIAFRDLKKHEKGFKKKDGKNN